MSFTLIKQDPNTRARLGKYQTAHGAFETPIFMPVGTVGAVKALLPHQVADLGAQIILGNTYHLYLRPGHKLVQKLGGLHKFMAWDKPILTDSGGFQVFSLARLAKVKPEGVFFQSHIDGSKHLLSPELAIEIQESLNSDIMMCLDECLPYPSDEATVEKSIALTVDWERRCLLARTNPNNHLFAIIQGSMYKHLRQRCTEELVNLRVNNEKLGISDLSFNGFAIGGVSVGEPMELDYEITDYTTPLLPQDKPRYLMGVGMPIDMITAIGHGIDMFDCVIPTRNARNGMLFVKTGDINIRNSRFTEDPRPIDENCPCYTCQHFSRAYLRHLSMSKEILWPVLGSIHNLQYYISLLSDARRAIADGVYAAFQKEFNRLQQIGTDDL